jgi:hypothetical protein
MDTDDDPLLFLALDFDLEDLKVPCFQAEAHDDPSNEIHTGPSHAEYYVRFECQHCDTGGHVVPACSSWTLFLTELMLDRQYGWPHDPGCQGFNPYADSITIEPMSPNSHL